MYGWRYNSMAEYLPFGVLNSKTTKNYIYMIKEKYTYD
jgi:hypothetical protein